jgi:hypothetical protein
LAGHAIGSGDGLHQARLASPQRSAQGDRRSRGQNVRQRGAKLVGFLSAVRDKSKTVHADNVSCKGFEMACWTLEKGLTTPEHAMFAERLAAARLSDS